MELLNLTIEDFINHCKYEKNLSAKTIEAYSIDLAQLSQFLQKKQFSTEMSQITKVEIRSFLEEISSLKPKSIKRKIATIKAMFNFLEFEDKILINPFRKMQIRISEPQRLPKAMDIKEITKIFQMAHQKISEHKNPHTYGHLASLRDLIVVELLFASGARVSEIADLKKENIDLYTGGIIIRGKGDKERVIQVCNNETIKILKQYYNLFRDMIEKSGGYFLVNRLGNKLSDQSIRNIVKKLSEDAGIAKKVTPHMFRHSVATLLLEKDVDIKYIQSILGHSSIMTTQIYTQVNRKKQRQILTSKHPRRDFTMPVYSSLDKG